MIILLISMLHFKDLFILKARYWTPYTIITFDS